MCFGATSAWRGPGAAVERHGRVFRLPHLSPEAAQYVSRVSVKVSEFGEAARVKVTDKPAKATAEGEPVVKVKWASAHDLRRSFGFRWSRRIMPAELQELMRHADIQTTMQYYVGRNAQSTAEALWAAYRAAGGNAGNTMATVSTDGGRARQGADTANH